MSELIEGLVKDTSGYYWTQKKNPKRRGLASELKISNINDIMKRNRDETVTRTTLGDVVAEFILPVELM